METTSDGDATTRPSAPVRLLRLVLAPCVTALALATAAGLALEPFRPGSAVHVHWLGSGPLDAVVAAVFSVLVLARAPLEARWGRRARIAASAVTAVAAVLAAASARAYARAVAGGEIADDGSAPNASVLAALLLGAWAAVALVPWRPATGAWRRAGRWGAVALASGLLVHLWIGAVGAVDAGARATADAIVVFGSKVNVDGRPSGSLVDRTVTACRLHARGAAPVLVLSGGRSPGRSVSEPEAMRAIALAEGVPASALILDEGGADTAATVENVAALARERGWRRVLAVSHDYHLARIRLLCERAGIPVRTVPAVETCPDGWKVAARAREIVAWAAAWLL